MDCYVDTYFSELWGHENPQYPICAKSRNAFVVIFVKFHILWISKLHTYIAIYTLHSAYVVLSNFVRELFPLKSLIKEVGDNLGMNIENLDIVSRSTVYEDNMVQEL